MWKELEKISFIKNLLKNINYPLSFTKLSHRFYTKKNSIYPCKIQFIHILHIAYYYYNKLFNKGEVWRS